ncbi:MAG: phosphate regulon transcriptional regulatory protein PhoB [Rhodobacterales bacterium]|nr:phosphate regulon transcriptional regulatory protein PhoB [Rhodobacterales bacterium]
MARARILVVDDEAAQREIIVYNLEAAGFEVMSADNGEDAVLMVQEEHPNLVVLDWMMPKLSGLEVCRQLRSNKETKEIPIILLSARSEEVDKVRGLEIGADDYVSKPFSVVELMARINAQLRRHSASLAGEKLTYMDIELHSDTHRVFRSDTEIKLGPTEFRLLSFFMERPGLVRSREQLLDHVWGREVYVESRTVDVHVGRLRKALTKNGGDDPIRTVRGSGYSIG